MTYAERKVATKLKSFLDQGWTKSQLIKLMKNMSYCDETIVHLIYIAKHKI